MGSLAQLIGPEQATVQAHAFSQVVLVQLFTPLHAMAQAAPLHCTS